MLQYFKDFLYIKRRRQASFTFLCSLCLLLSGCHMIPYPTTEFSQNNLAHSTYNSPLFLSMDKQEFATQAMNLYWSQNPDASLWKNTETIDELILQAVRLAYPDRTLIHEQLTAYGIYAMPYDAPNMTDHTDSAPMILSVTNPLDSVFLYPPSIYYQVPTDQWIVAFSGTWLNDSWKHDKEWGHDLGGCESFGVHIEDHGNYPGMICNRTCGALYSTGKYASIEAAAAYDANGNPGAVSTGNRSFGSPADGFCFQLQDRVEADFPYIHVTYLGYSWAGLCVYSSEFVNLEGTLTAYYIHTYGENMGGYELPLHLESALDGIAVTINGDPVPSDNYFVRYSQGLTLSPTP